MATRARGSFFTSFIAYLVFIQSLQPALSLYKNSYKYKQYEMKVKSHNEYKTCREKSIEEREEKANVVFTGTIRSILPDYEHPAMKKAQVEVKRVMKGQTIVNRVPGNYLGNNYHFVPWHRRIITLEGIEDPHICHSHARKYDTRIFLANLNGNGNLKLNSSIVRLTMNNIKHAEAAVKDIPFRPEPTEPPDPCERRYCAFGGQCVVGEDRMATCKCLENCSDVFAPVCGSDGVTYSSLCHLRVASCSDQRRIKKVSSGSCDVKDPCDDKPCYFGAQCVPSLDGLTARCQCPERCDNYGDSRDSLPLCGDDGKDYNNLCEMKRTSCDQMKEIKSKYQGRCDPCKGYECQAAQVCLLDEKRKPTCSCNDKCNLEFAPVCGSDGSTYSNECIMRSEACKRRKEIRMLFRGECSTGDNPCTRLSCGPGEECHVDRTGQARCICPPPCEAVLRPVCGSDGVTYDNECELRRKSCQSGRTNSVRFVGECTPDGPCTTFKCNHGATCVVRSGKPDCMCPTCSEEFQPVCGSDGVSYTNECKLRTENCENRGNVMISYHGQCNGCANMKCDYYSVCESDGKNDATCVCQPRSSCNQVEDKVCGTDGVTYQNKCYLQVASCESKQFIIVATHGPCDQCADVKCHFGARCENGKCVCPQRCPDTNEPVCANDGQTYTNECEMRRQSCSQGDDLVVVRSGECDTEIASGSGEESSGVEVCDETTCKYGGTCDYDAEGPVICVCNFNCDALRSPVCGSDGKTYGNDCEMREEACRKQLDITAQDMDNCEDLTEELCDGKSPLVNPMTGQEYDCGAGHGICPSGSYCHRLADGMSRCCKEEIQIRSCQDSKYGCCPDGETHAPGRNNAGCPSVCVCNPLGSFGSTCDPYTGQCTCKPGVGGTRCDRCEPGFWGLPKIADGNSGCIPCGCNMFGSVRDDCEQMTGRCVCKIGITGQKCNLCPDGKVLSHDGCTDATHKALTCRDITCRYGSTCKFVNSSPECVCPANCSSDNSPVMVCGSDGVTYGSSCQLRLFACRRQKSISVAYPGPCQGNTQTATPRTTTRSRKTTRHISKDGNQQPTPSGPEFGKVGDVCLYDSDCAIENSYCEEGRCVCKDGLTPTADNTECEDQLWAMLNDQWGVLGSAIPSFSGNSYLQLKKYHHGSKVITIDIEFRTLNNDGILLYSAHGMEGRGDFISLAINDGYLEFRYDLGSGAAVIKSMEKVTLNKFHHATAKRFDKDGMLKLDGHETAGVSPGAHKSLNLGTPVYLGYVPNGGPEVFKYIGVSNGFVGCIDSLVLDSEEKKVYDLTYPGTSPDIQFGFGISECKDNPCQSLPCQNGGTCSPISDYEFSCQCSAGYYGKMCEAMEEMDSACMPNPCLAGGTCTTLPEGYFCSCPPHRHGDKCEKTKSTDITVPQFHGNSYMKVKLDHNIGREFNYEIWFFSSRPDGVIMYSEQVGTSRGDFLSLNLVNSHVQLRFDLGGGSANITTPEPLPLNKWHQVGISRINRAGDMTINGGEPIRGHSEGEMKQLNLPETMYLGGHPRGYHPDAGITSGLYGAIQRFYEAGQLHDNLVAGAIDKHHVTQFLGPPCDNGHNPCHHGGECMPHLNEFICKCPPKYTGRQCERVTNDLDPNHPVAFDGRTHHRYPNRVKTKQRSQNSNKFEVVFRTRASEGMILLIHKSTTTKGDYLAIALNYGRVEVSFNLGKESAEQLLFVRSNVRVNDGQWHKLTFDREKRQSSLSIDNGPTESAVSTTGATQLDTDGNLWIGGSRSTPRGLPTSYYRGFDGCIRSVTVDDEPLNLVQDRTSHGSVEFCQL